MGGGRGPPIIYIYLQSQARLIAAEVIAAWRHACMEMQTEALRHVAGLMRHRGAQIAERLVMVGQIWLLLVDIVAHWHTNYDCIVCI